MAIDGRFSVVVRRPPRSVQCAAMRSFLMTAALILAVSASCANASALIRTTVRLDKKRYFAGEPVFIVWDYTNTGRMPLSFDRTDPYCPEPSVISPTLPFAEPTVFPNGHDERDWDCESIRGSLQPGETYEEKFLLNHRFNLSTPGEYSLAVPVSAGKVGAVQLHLVLEPAREQALRAAYQPYIEVLNSGSAPDMSTPLRVLADSGEYFAEDELLRFSSDRLSPSNGIANEGLARLKGAVACARLAQLAEHPELHYQQSAIDKLGQCDEPGYMNLLFGLADRQPEMRQFAVVAAGEAGGNAAVDRLLELISQGSPDREAGLWALGRTGSVRAAGAIVDLLSSLTDEFSRYAALQSLKTLTHRESTLGDYTAQQAEWKRWWANPTNRNVYKPRDWRVPLTPLS